MGKTLDYWDLQYHVENVQPGVGRSALCQGAYQIAALGTTLAFAVVGGLVTGLILQLPFFNQAGRNAFTDDEP